MEYDKNMNKYKLIACDMDGTLLNSKREISKLNVEIIKKVKKQGIKFVIASGRHSNEIANFIKPYNINLDIIGLNGAEIKNEEGNILFTQTIPKESVCEIIQILEKNKMFYKCYSISEIIACCPDRINEILKGFVLDRHGFVGKDDDIRKYYIKLCGNCKRVDSIIDYIINNNLPILKIEVLSTDKAELMRLKNLIIGTKDTVITSSYKNNIEITNSQVNKGAALEMFAKKNGIKKEQIISFGDNLNDMEMIGLSGVGIAMANGLEEIKSIADHVTLSNDENGVFHGICKYIQPQVL